MNQKERSLFVVIALLKDDTEKETILEKVKACFHLMRPEILLSDKGKKIYEQEVNKAKRKGQIP